MNRDAARIGRGFPAAPAILLALALAFPPAVPAGDEPFTGPSNSGLTGLLEIPTARVMRENRYRLGVAQVHPYRYYFGTVGLFERLEVNGRFTEVLGVESARTGENLRDKAVDLKAQLLREGKYLPAFSLAVYDPHGTRIYASQSLVASKQIFPFDFTLGIGNGRFGKTPLPEAGEKLRFEMFSHPRSWWRDAQWFGGVQFAPADWLSLTVEYSPIRYQDQTRDFAQSTHFREPVRSKINAGLRIRPLRWLELAVSWQRGEEFGVGVSTDFEIGRPLLPIHDPPYAEPEPMRSRPLEDRIAAALQATGFSDIGVEQRMGSLRIDAENDRYFFTPNAVEALLDALAPMVPPGIDSLRIRIKENGIPVAGFLTEAATVRSLREERISRERFFASSRFFTGNLEAPIPRTIGRRRFDAGAGPSFEGFLNDPSRYFSFRLGANAYLHAFPWKGGTAAASVEGYPWSTVTPSDVRLSRPVRSDISQYKEQKVSAGRLLFEQIGKAPYPVFGRIAAGFLEIQYAGADAEAAAPLLGGRVIAGAGGSLVRKRSPDRIFGFANGTWYHTGFLTARLNLPEANLWFDVKGGRFLAGDYGARFSVSKFVRGVTLTAWYATTDTSVFSDEFNRGYHDKGISVTIPARLFLGRDSRTTYRMSLSPWTRDAGQDIDHFRTLPDFIGRNTDITLDKDRGSLYKETW